jgi:hypothetical protein
VSDFSSLPLVANRMDAMFFQVVRACCALLCFAQITVGTQLHAEDLFANRSRGESSTLEFKEDISSEFYSPEAAQFDEWETIVEHEPLTDNTVKWNDPSVKTIDWLRHFGLRHSSSEGRHIGRGVPLEGSSWLNRPFHVDWFVGTLLGDELLTNRVELDNEVLAGFRIGYDFDYFWGLDWRFGWSHPNTQVEGVDEQATNGSYFISDVDLKYFPWGDTKVRPFWLIGMGMARIRFLDDNNVSQNVTLATLPLGVGVEFPQFPWLAWRLEIIDNLAFGADGVNTLNNFSFTAGMDLRFGAKPNSYWPWRTSRRIW